MIIIENVDNYLEFVIEVNAKLVSLSETRFTTTTIPELDSKYLQYNEDFNTLNNMFELSSDLSPNEVTAVGKKLDEIFSTEVKAIVENELCSGGLFEIIPGVHNSSKNKRDTNISDRLSYSYYFDLFYTYSIPNVSGSAKKRISNIRLKMSTHLTDWQDRDLFGPNASATSYFIEMPPKYEGRIEKCLENIYNNYLTFVGELESCNRVYKNYIDIPANIRSILEEYRKQMIK